MKKSIKEKIGLFVLPGAIKISFFLDLDNDKYNKS